MLLWCVTFLVISVFYHNPWSYVQIECKPFTCISIYSIMLIILITMIKVTKQECSVPDLRFPNITNHTTRIIYLHISHHLKIFLDPSTPEDGSYWCYLTALSFLSTHNPLSSFDPLQQPYNLYPLASQVGYWSGSSSFTIQLHTSSGTLHTTSPAHTSQTGSPTITCQKSDHQTFISPRGPCISPFFVNLTLKRRWHHIPSKHQEPLTQQ